MNDSNFEVDNSELVGLRGWLILVGFSLIISPLLILYLLLTVHLPIFSDGTFALLTDSSNELYIQGFSPLLSFEILGNIIFIFTCIYLVILFFRKSKSFPVFFIYYRLGYCVFLTLDIIFAKMVFPSEIILDPITLRDLIGAYLGTIIWIPYMLRSKRVKLTFIS